jgi:hypothetical protein
MYSKNLHNTTLQHPVALCRSDLTFHFCHLCATSVNVHPSSLYCKSQYMFQPNCPSSGALTVCLKKLLFCFFFTVIVLGSLFYVGNMLQPCIC